MRGSRSRSTMLATGLVCLMACTPGEQETPDDASRAGEPPVSSTTLASGEELPAGCARDTPGPEQTVAFVAEGRAWALDPSGDRLTCLFRVRDPGPFTWGPQGDRVLLGDLEVRGLSPEAPTLPALDARPAAFDWGHPIGRAVVYASRGGVTPERLNMDDGSVESMPSLPEGRYLDVAYHPSGEGLAFVIDQDGEHTIWLSDNYGDGPVPLVSPEGGTRLTSIAFTPDGQRLLWTAQHAAGYSHIHSMDLADRTDVINDWRGESSGASNLHLAPTGSLMAIDEGSNCAERTATIIFSLNKALPALADAKDPTTVVGWLDGTTLLVAVGGCDESLDLVAVDVTDDVTPLVFAAEVAATRTVTPSASAPTSVPAPPGAPEEETPSTGVG